MRRRRLVQPVVSVGNLSTGGSGKTPVAAHIARLLLAGGERPAILTRGYARTSPSDGVTVVSDGATVLATLARAGDEPLMLARALPGAIVLVGSDRYLSGRLAEERFGATVHLLDDGFQHVALERDVDLVIASPSDLDDRVLPAGRLREPLATAALADALLLSDASPADAVGLQKRLGVGTAFHIRRIQGMPRSSPSGETVDPTGHRVLAVAGIARPERFFDDLAKNGWRVVETLAFRDHHPFAAADVEKIARAASAADATLVLATDKDAVRLDALDLQGVRVAAVPLTLAIDPPGFADWLLAKIRTRA
jgi:tetraacyldisaccharide 4'-kinase